MIETIYIVIDPDMRLLNAAIITDQAELKAVFARKNKEGTDNTVLIKTSRLAYKLTEDILAYCVAEESLHHCKKIVLVIESQNMMHTKRSREKGKNINYEDIKNLALTTGCLMTAFGWLCTDICLIEMLNLNVIQFKHKKM